MLRSRCCRRSLPRSWPCCSSRPRCRRRCCVLGVRDWRCYAIAFLWWPTIIGIQTGEPDAADAVRAGARLALPRSEVGRRAGGRTRRRAEALLLAGADLVRRHAPLPDGGDRGGGVRALSSSCRGQESGSRDSAAIRIFFRVSRAVEGPRSYSVAALLHSMLPSWTAATALETRARRRSSSASSFAAGRRGRDRDAFALSIVAILVLSPLLEMHYLALLLVVVALYRRTFGLAWAVPLLFWGAPGNHRGFAGSGRARSRRRRGCTLAVAYWDWEPQAPKLLIKGWEDLSRSGGVERRPRALSNERGGSRPYGAAGGAGARRRPRLGRHPLPERGGEHRPVRERGAARARRARLDGEVIVVDNGSDDGSGVLAQSRRRPGRRRAAARLRQRLPRRLRRGQGRLHRDDRRRPHVRLRGDPALHPGARRRCRAGHGEPDGRRPARRDAHAEPHRQPAHVSLPQPALPHSDQRHVVRHASVQARRPPGARPAVDRHGVRLGDGDPSGPARPRDPRGADRPPSAGGRVEAVAVQGRLALAAPDARLPPELPLPVPRSVRRRDRRSS